VLALLDNGGVGADFAARLDQLDRVDQLVALVALSRKMKNVIQTFHRKSFVLNF
jgi:hypothetical protein